MTHSVLAAMMLAATMHPALMAKGHSALAARSRLEQEPAIPEVAAAPVVVVADEDWPRSASQWDR
jgi:hypothetical protein